MSLALYLARVRSNEVLGGTYLYHVALGRRLGHCLARFSQRFDMQLYGIANKLQYFAASFSGREASGKIWDVCAVTRPALLNHNEIFHNSCLSHFLRPAILRMLLSVPGGMSMPSFPATVTVPGFSGC